MLKEIGPVANLSSMYLAFKSSTQGSIQAGAMKANTSPSKVDLKVDLNPPLKQFQVGVG